MALQARGSALRGATIDTLPDDVLQRIWALAHSANGGHVERLRVAFVCRRWWELAYRQPSLWASLDLAVQSGVSFEHSRLRLRTPAAIEAWFAARYSMHRRIAAHVQSLDVCGSDRIDVLGAASATGGWRLTDLLRPFEAAPASAPGAAAAAAGPALRRLALQGRSQLPAAVLQALRLQRFPHLEQLRLEGPAVLPAALWGAALGGLPRLRSLELELTAGQMDLAAIPDAALAGLTCLEVTRWAAPAQAQALLPLAKRAPALQRLVLRDHKPPAAPGLEAFPAPARFPQLQSFHYSSDQPFIVAMGGCWRAASCSLSAAEAAPPVTGGTTGAVVLGSRVSLHSCQQPGVALLLLQLEAGEMDARMLVSQAAAQVPRAAAAAARELHVSVSQSGLHYWAQPGAPWPAAHLPPLTLLHLQDCCCQRQGLVAALQTLLPQLPGLTELAVLCTAGTSQEPGPLPPPDTASQLTTLPGALASLRRLRRLALRGHAFSPRSVGHWSDVFTLHFDSIGNMRGLVELDLACNRLGPANLLSLKRAKSLTRLALGGNPQLSLSAAQLKAFAACMPRLAQLELWGTSTRQEAVGELLRAAPRINAEVVPAVIVVEDDDASGDAESGDAETRDEESGEVRSCYEEATMDGGGDEGDSWDGSKERASQDSEQPPSATAPSAIAGASTAVAAAAAAAAVAAVLAAAGEAPPPAGHDEGVGSAGSNSVEPE